MDIKRESFLKKIDYLETVGSKSTYRSQDIGPGLFKKLKRLLFYRGFYLKKIWEQSGLMPEKDVYIQTFWGRGITLPNRDLNARKIFKHGILGKGEQSLIRFFIKNFKSNDIFYDIGTNYGFYTALAQEFIYEGEIHSFEPNTHVFKYLQQLEENYDNTLLNKLACSDVNDEVTFFDGYSKHKSGKSTLMSEVAEKNHMQTQEVVVKATTLDDYTERHKIPTIIKIDVEGSEYKVLNGAKKTLREHSPVIAIELWRGEGSRFSKKNLEILKEFHYKPHTISTIGEIREIKYEVLKENLAVIGPETNFIFKKN
jgi:FkbM family methyltransferase